MPMATSSVAGCCRPVKQLRVTWWDCPGFQADDRKQGVWLTCVIGAVKILCTQIYHIVSIGQLTDHHAIRLMLSGDTAFAKDGNRTEVLTIDEKLILIK